uniref:Uncharacterized protein n=1 Tax=Anguilla anguilla TaxID=7936 RepID=A0A0E9U4A5_ANGAN
MKNELVSGSPVTYLPVIWDGQFIKS